MAGFLETLGAAIFFWMAWIIIPFIMEIIPALGGFCILVKKRFTIKKKDLNMEGIFPEITMIVPVYNSADTLFDCIKSINDSTYPNELINIMLVNNMSTDNSFDEYQRIQSEFSDLSMQWLNSKQGKSKALNMALFNAKGKYIIHIDSDGILDKDAIQNIVTRFECNEDIHCVTGAIMVNPEMVDNTKGFMKRLFRKCEFFEYAQAFLAGRNFQSELNSVFTLSGAFSAFRKSTILKTQMYNTDTICEDTHVTLQIRKILKQKVHLCENAIFYVEPIDDVAKMYTQRQRWQRGELEVAHMFLENDMKLFKGFVSNFMVRVIIFDHTFAFPRMIWYFALLCLMLFYYNLSLVVGSVAIIFTMYIISSFLFYLVILGYLKEKKDLRKYYMKKWYLCILMPFYNFIIFWFRFAGIINGINSDSAWRARTPAEEREAFKDVVRKDFKHIAGLLGRLRKVANNEADIK